MSDIFERLQPSPGRESVLKKVSCHNLTAVNLSSSTNEFKLVVKGQENNGIEVSGSSGMVPVLALKPDLEIDTPQKIPTRHAAIIPLEKGRNFSVLLGASPKNSELYLDVDTSKKTVSFKTQTVILDEDHPIQVGRNPRDIWKDGAPQIIEFPAFTSVFGISSKHLSISIIDLEGNSYILIEDLSKYGISVQFNEQKRNDVNISDPNMFISDPGISSAQLQKLITQGSFPDSSPQVFDSQSGMSDSKPGWFDSNPPNKSVLKQESESTSQIGAATESSPFHTKNEDAYKISLEEDTALLADGMGGHKYADLASKSAVSKAADNIHEIKTNDSLDSIEINLKESIKLADTEVRKKTKNEGATTLSIAKIVRKDDKRTLVYAHSGDSRIVIKRGNHLIPVSQDHSILWRDFRRGVLNEKEYNRISKLLDNIEDPTKLDSVALKYFKNRNILTECVGRGDLDIESGQIELQDGDQVVLYSDGVSDTFTSSQIVSSLNKSKMPSVQAKILVSDVELFSTDPKNVYHDKNTHVRGKPDDITVIVME